MKAISFLIMLSAIMASFFALVITAPTDVVHIKNATAYKNTFNQLKDYQAAHDTNHSAVGTTASWGNPLQTVITVSPYCYSTLNNANQSQLCPLTNWQGCEFRDITDEVCTRVSQYKLNISF